MNFFEYLFSIRIQPNVETVFPHMSFNILENRTINSNRGACLSVADDPAAIILAQNYSMQWKRKEIFKSYARKSFISEQWQAPSKCLFWPTERLVSLGPPRRKTEDWMSSWMFYAKRCKQKALLMVDFMPDGTTIWNVSTFRPNIRNQERPTVNHVHLHFIHTHTVRSR